MSVLEDIFHVLDTPGAYARGALAGKFGERASGEDVLRNFGVSDPNKWAGMGAEMLLDPLNLVPGGLGIKALRGASKAKKSNKLSKMMVSKGAMPADVAEKTLVRGSRGQVGPKVVYHGAQRGFDKIDSSRFDKGALFGPGHYTTADHRIAAEYAMATRPPAQGVANAAARAKFYKPGRKISDVKKSNAEMGISKNSKEYQIVVKHDPKKGLVLVQDHNGYGKPTGKPWWHKDTVTRGEYDKAFNPKAPNIRPALMDSRKPFDMEHAMSSSELDGMTKRMKEAGFHDTVDRMAEIADSIEYRKTRMAGRPPGVGDYEKMWEPFTKEEAYNDITEILEEEMHELLYAGTEMEEPSDEVYAMSRDFLTDILKDMGYDSIRHTGGGRMGGGNLMHDVHIGLLGQSQMYLPHVAPAIQKVRKTHIGIAAGTAGSQGEVKIGLRPREEKQIGLRP